MAVAELRKFKMSLILIFQDLSCLTKGELDLGPKVLSQCGIQITFQQQNPEDVELLAKHFAYPSLDLTPLMDTRDRPDGFLRVANSFSHLRSQCPGICFKRRVSQQNANVLEADDEIYKPSDPAIVILFGAAERRQLENLVARGEPSRRRSGGRNLRRLRATLPFRIERRQLVS